MIHRTAALDVDVLVVGAGPTGLYATFYAGLRQLIVAVLDELPEVGGQLTALYPQKPIYDVAGLPSATGAELVRALHRQSQLASPSWVLGERATVLERSAGPDGDRFVVTTDLGTRVTAGGIVVTAGIGSFSARRLPVAEHLEGRGLHYHVGSAAQFADQDVVVVGGGDSAVDWANILAPVASSVTLVHRRRALTAHPASINELTKHGVRVVLESEILAVDGVDRLERVHVAARRCEPEVLTATAMVAALGQVADLGPLRAWGLEMAERRHIVVDRRMETSVPGVYAAGDVTTYEGKVRIMTTGFGEAATAVNNLAARLRPGAAVFPGHSTDLLAPAGAR